MRLKAQRLLFILLLVVVFPHFLVYFPGLPRWVGRLVATSFFFAFMTGGIFWCGLSPRFVIVRKGAKLENSRWKRSIESGLRLLIIAFGVFWLVKLTIPLGADVWHLGLGGPPMRVRAAYAGRASHSPRVNIPFLWEQIYLQKGSEVGGYSLLYSVSRFTRGQEYEWVVLPRSRMILDSSRS